MIRSDYRSYLSRLMHALAKYKFPASPISEKDLEVVFDLGGEWHMKLDCERFGAGVTVSICHPHMGPNDGYAVWILMKAFEEITGEVFGPPSPDNQIGFLRKFHGQIFFETTVYDERYRKINTSTMR